MDPHAPEPYTDRSAAGRALRPSPSRVSHHDVAVVVPASADAPALVDPLAVDVEGLGQRVGGGGVARPAGPA
jgi:hypothetical protein